MVKVFISFSIFIIDKWGMIGANTLQGSMKFIDKMGQISIFNLK